MTNAQTEARAIVIDREHYEAADKIWRLSAVECKHAIATALAAKDAELAETASALWRIPPNVHTVPCEANGFAEPDPFEGVGETYADAYTREKARAEAAEAALAEVRKALERIELRTRSVPSDTAEDDKRDKYHANSIARRALTGDTDHD